MTRNRDGVFDQVLARPVEGSMIRRRETRGSCSHLRRVSLHESTTSERVSLPRRGPGLLAKTRSEIHSRSRTTKSKE